MSNNENKDYINNLEENEIEKFDDEMSLDNDQRVKVLSPSALVLKRFIRNRLAITGMIFIFGMFLFSYVGGWVMPYDEDEVFKKYEPMFKIYAGITINEELKYTVADGQSFDNKDFSQFILTTSTGETMFTSGDSMFYREEMAEDVYQIYTLDEVGISLSMRGEVSVSTTDDSLDAGFGDVAMAAINGEAAYFEYQGQKFVIAYSAKSNTIYRATETAMSSKNVYDFANQDQVKDYELVKAIEEALIESATSVTINGVEYSVNIQESVTEVLDGDSLYATISRYQIEPFYADTFLDLEFKERIREAVDADETGFTYNENGEDKIFRLSRENMQWTLEHEESTYLIDEYSSPSLEHWMGTDGNGMDLLTRLMYGGRISLRIGFLVVIIETFIGIILGGIAGYFGKWLDNLVMRIVDIFNCIPSIPLVIILGSVMDQLRIDPNVRLNILMLVLAVLGWPGIARMVRGQILTLREQEFMTATEATGIRVSKRIFKHLIPNIIPQLIVICTLSLGSVILTESVLSFLGVGVKFPFASWGNIINAVSNVYVMSNYLFVWIPAGICILITVLGFNFIGDGLRDAFDPKAKR